MVAERKKTDKNGVTWRRPELSALEKAKIRTLYVCQNLSYQEIGVAIGRDRGFVSRYVTRSGLAKMKRAREASLIAKTDREMEGTIDGISAALADECEEIALSATKNAREELTSPLKDAAKNFQAWTAGIRNLTTARNLARGIGNADTALTEGGNRNVNLFFMGASGAAGAGKEAPINVTASVARVADVSEVL